MQSCRERVRAAEQELDRERQASERLAHDEEAVAPDDLARGREHREAEARTSVLDKLAALGSSTEALARQRLAVVLEAAADVLREYERAAEGRRQLDEVHRQAVADAERKRRVLENPEATWSDWKSEWTAALAVLGPGPANPEAVTARVDASAG